MTVTGVSAVRNWILRHFTEDAIVMLDDDITRLRLHGVAALPQALDR